MGTWTGLALTQKETVVWDKSPLWVSISSSIK